jgi:hypothetical protein
MPRYHSDSAQPCIRSCTAPGPKKSAPKVGESCHITKAHSASAQRMAMASHWELTGLDFLTGFSHLMSPVVSEGVASGHP